MNIVGASVSEAFYAAHETRDIVLPNQTEHVSQIAVDVTLEKKNITNFVVLIFLPFSLLFYIYR